MRPIESGVFTTADLELTPDDGMRYELIDGVVLVTPSSSRIHQRAHGRLSLRMVGACPEHLEVMLGPFEFRPNRQLALLPDLLVFPRDAVGPERIEKQLLLAVEILASATHTVDRVLKRHLYERAGVTSYWMLDPSKEQLTVLELVSGAYVERAVVVGKDVFEAELPFPVRVVPADLVC
jgi:Uma2 family endonuclease